MIQCVYLWVFNIKGFLRWCKGNNYQKICINKIIYLCCVTIHLFRTYPTTLHISSFVLRKWKNNNRQLQIIKNIIWSVCEVFIGGFVKTIYHRNLNINWYIVILLHFHLYFMVVPFCYHWLIILGFKMYGYIRRWFINFIHSSSFSFKNITKEQ